MGLGRGRGAGKCVDHNIAKSEDQCCGCEPEVVFCGVADDFLSTISFL